MQLNYDRLLCKVSLVYLFTNGRMFTDNNKEVTDNDLLFIIIINYGYAHYNMIKIFSFYIIISMKLITDFVENC